MATVQKFDRNMIERSLQSVSLKFLKDNDGDYLVQLGYSDEMGCELDIMLMASGQQDDVYYMRGQSNKRIPRNDWGRAVMLCNTWNKERRWPKAYLYVKDPNTDATGLIILEQQFDLEQGIHQELFNDFTRVAIASMLSFWEWAHKEQSF